MIGGTKLKYKIYSPKYDLQVQTNEISSQFKSYCPPIDIEFRNEDDGQLDTKLFLFNKEESIFSIETSEPGLVGQYGINLVAKYTGE